MHDAFEMGEDRHARLGLHPRDQALAAARHDHVDGAVQAGEHGADGGAVAGRDQRDAILRQVRVLQPLHEAGMDQPRGMEALGPRAQNGGIAGLEAQGAGVGGDIGTAFENHADDAERRGDPLDAQPVGALEGLQHAPDRIGQIGDVIEALRHAGDAPVVEQQPVEHRRRQVFRPRAGHVERIGLQQLFRPRAQKGRGGAQRAVLLLRRRQREFARGLARLAAERQQARFKIVGAAVDHVQAFHRHRSSVFTGLKMGSEI